MGTKLPGRTRLAATTGGYYPVGSNGLMLALT
jgi:hypothetical protein